MKKARLVEGNLLTSVHMTPDCIVTVSRAALVKFWQRPPKQSLTGRQKKLGQVKEFREGRERELRSPGLVSA